MSPKFVKITKFWCISPNSVIWSPKYCKKPYATATFAAWGAKDVLVAYFIFLHLWVLEVIITEENRFFHFLAIFLYISCQNPYNLEYPFPPISGCLKFMKNSGDVFDMKRNQDLDLQLNPVIFVFFGTP